MLDSLNIARYRFHLRVTEHLRLPEYAGSTLRGVFGRALMQLSGINFDDIKNKTPLFLQSPYARIFEPDPQVLGQTPHKGMFVRISKHPFHRESQT